MIIWLASYPKSGNTWLRLFLANLMERNRPADINALDFCRIASAGSLFDEAVGYESGMLTHAEIERLRPEVYEYIAAKSKGPLFVKIHDAYTYTTEGKPLVPADATHGAIYIIRNPLDVCVSSAHHSGHTNFDKIIARMADNSFAMCSHRDSTQLPQRLLSWRAHVLSWLDAPPSIPVHLMRYEDMKVKPLQTFTLAAAFAGLRHEPARIQDAIKRSSFDELQRQEQQHGFREKAPACKLFFRQGEIGSWRRALTPEQAARIIRDHGDVMQRVGYLSELGKPIF